MLDERNKQAERLVTGLLSSSKFPDKALPDDFEAALHRRLVEATVARPEPVSRWTLFLRPVLVAVAFAAVFAVGIWVGRSIPEKSDGGVSLAEQEGTQRLMPQLVTAKTVVKRGEPVTIRLVYDSIKDIDDVRFTIVLDRGVRFRSDDPEIAAAGKLEWIGTLTAGRNEIPVVVFSDDVGERVVRAHAHFNGSVVENVVTLLVKEESNA